MSRIKRLDRVFIGFNTDYFLDCFFLHLVRPASLVAFTSVVSKIRVLWLAASAFGRVANP